MDKTLYGNPENRMADDRQHDDEQGISLKTKSRENCGWLENWKPAEVNADQKLKGAKNE